MSKETGENRPKDSPMFGPFPSPLPSPAPLSHDGSGIFDEMALPVAYGTKPNVCRGKAPTAVRYALPESFAPSGFWGLRPAGQ